MRCLTDWKESTASKSDQGVEAQRVAQEKSLQGSLVLHFCSSRDLHPPYLLFFFCIFKSDAAPCEQYYNELVKKAAKHSNEDKTGSEFSDDTHRIIHNEDPREADYDTITEEDTDSNVEFVVLFSFVFVISAKL